MERRRRSSTSGAAPFDPLLPLKVLCAVLMAKRGHLLALEELGIVIFEWRRIGRWPGRVGRVSWFADIPIYCCAEAGRMIGVCGRTVRRWAEAGDIKRERVGHLRRLRITPREVFRVKHERALWGRNAKLPSLEACVTRPRTGRGGHDGD